jgi:hypothetical protein
MGMTLKRYPPAPLVLDAYVTALARQTPSAIRYVNAVTIASALAEQSPAQSSCTTAQRNALVRRYVTVLDQQNWCDAIHQDPDLDTDFYAWFAAGPAARRRLPQ